MLLTEVLLHVSKTRKKRKKKERLFSLLKRSHGAVKKKQGMAKRMTRIGGWGAGWSTIPEELIQESIPESESESELPN